MLLSIKYHFLAREIKANTLIIMVLERMTATYFYTEQREK